MEDKTNKAVSDGKSPSIENMEEVKKEIENMEELKKEEVRLFEHENDLPQDEH